uniref:F-box domain-containing protein n=1 Tax=Meloidogyne enterolobii TaxID=390850 RepID=A0A6V7U120_MELEN|nr:unnamed protein product [Meloidogyne enterolobii]
MHYLLPPEIQLDIFKYLNFNQLLSFQQTNIYFKNFIGKYEKDLARMCLYEIEIVNIAENNTNKYKLFKPETKVYGFQLGKLLEKKWMCVIDESIPVFLSTADTNINIVGYLNDEYIYLQFTNHPKNVEEMKIVRYLLEQLFNCCFNYFYLSHIIFNPQIIGLLFEEDKTNLPRQIYSQYCCLFINNELLSKSPFNYILSNKIDINIVDSELEQEEIDILFNMLINEGNRFLSADFMIFQNLAKLINFIIQYLETSKDVATMVKQIRFIWQVNIPSEGAKDIKIKIENNIKYTTYQITNKYNPEMKFSIYIKEKNEMLLDAEINRLPN